jgi:hypothetical protein
MKTILALALLGSSTLALAAPPACDTTRPRSCASYSDWWTYRTFREFCPDAGLHGAYTTVEEQEQFRICSYVDGTQCIETQYQELNAC